MWDGIRGGGEGRINYGLLHILNSIHRAIANDIPALSTSEVSDRCSSPDRRQDKAFLNRVAAQVSQSAAETNKPKIVEIFIDVFGFPRGAAEARVFCTWLGELFTGNSLCGIPSKVRMLGISIQ
jgi:hypothetical protein